MTLKALLNVTSLPGSVCGHMPCVLWAGRTTNRSGLDPAHASLSARQAKQLGLMTSGTYGPPFIGSLLSAALSLSLASNLEALTRTSGSTLYKLTWKAWAMPSGRSRFRLRASVRHTSGTELIGWPTPTASAWKHPGNQGRQGGLNLQTATALAGWPTPASRDGKGGYQGGRIRNGKLSTDTLDVTAQIAGPVRLTVSGDLLTGCIAGMETGGQLNPDLSRWLMGLPDEWEKSAPTETLSTLKLQQRS